METFKVYTDYYKEMSDLEYAAWCIIREYPEELGFILDSKDYHDYLLTYYTVEDITEGPYITEDQFNIVKDYFKTRGR